VKRHTVILGCSPDAETDQKKFHARFKLPFSLLCDTQKSVAQAYGVWKEKTMYGKKVLGIERTTFLIGPDGKVSKVFSKVKPDGHAEQVLAELR
jgi:peroxiredoxin Q/BCP